MLLCKAALRSRFYLSCRRLHYVARSLHVHESVTKALESSKPVVALESTIITHGMPYPDNYRTAMEVESIVQQQGVTPATIAVIKGNIHVGMNDELMKILASDKTAKKLSRRDLAVACSKQHSGGTTVSATMMIAHWCGIKMFVTGGIGGVHRMGQDTLDISADLRELGRTPITVVSAGVKSILDIRRTLEFLETEGVTVAAFGESNDFPAFFTPSSGIQSPARVGTVDEAAALMRAHEKLKIDSGMLFAVPIPSKYADIGSKVENAIEEALTEAREIDIEGNEVTPYILKRVNELTGGLSLTANIALIKNNAEVGAKIAKQFYQKHECDNVNITATGNNPVVIGGCNLDIVSKCTNAVLRGGPSNPALVSQSLGGVGRNIAETLWRLNNKPTLISAVGQDHGGERMISDLSKMGVHGVASIPDHVTGVYSVVINALGEVDVAVEDSSIHNHIDINLIKRNEENLKGSSLICVDANIPEDTMRYVCLVSSRYRIPLLYEPTGDLKAAKGYMAQSPHDGAITYMTPNIAELGEIYRAVTGNKPLIVNTDGLTAGEELSAVLRVIAEMCKPLLEKTYCILVTMGSLGVLCAMAEKSQHKFVHYPLEPRPSWAWLERPIANASGAGDSFTAGFIHGLLRRDGGVDLGVRIGMTVAQRTLRSAFAVSPDITETDGVLERGEWKGKDVTQVVR